MTSKMEEYWRVHFKRKGKVIAEILIRYKKSELKAGNLDPTKEAELFKNADSYWYGGYSPVHILC